MMVEERLEARVRTTSDRLPFRPEETSKLLAMWSWWTPQQKFSVALVVIVVGLILFELLA